MTWDRLMLMALAAIFSLAYTICVFLAGVITGNGIAWKTALVCLGLCYVCYGIQFMYPAWRAFAAIVTIASIVAGASAGISLLVR